MCCDSCAGVRWRSYPVRVAAASTLSTVTSVVSAECVDCLGTGLLVDPSEAWEVLAARGLIPFAWIGEARRGFQRWYVGGCQGCGGSKIVPAKQSKTGRDEPCGHCAGSGRQERSGVLPRPLSTAACVALASDAAAVETAEAVAREVTRRRRVVWRGLPAGEYQLAWRMLGTTQYGDLWREWGRVPAKGLAPSTAEYYGLGDAVNAVHGLGYTITGVAGDAVVMAFPELAP